MIEPCYRQIGLTIRALRRSREMTQEQIADELGMLRSSFTQIESGNRKLQIHELITLSKLFRVPLTVLLSDDVKDEQEAMEWHEIIEEREWREYAR